MTKNSKDILEIVVKSVDDKRSEDIVVLDMQGVSILTDYNVITHGNSDRQIGSIAQGIIDDTEIAGLEVRRVEGRSSNQWVLIDLGDVVVHVFNEEERNFYNLEGLWTEAKLVDVSEWLED